MSTARRAITWATLTVLVLAHGCGAMLETTRPPPTASRCAVEPRSRNASDTLLKECVVAIRFVQGSYVRYHDWLFFRVEDRTFHVLQEN